MFLLDSLIEQNTIIEKYQKILNLFNEPNDSNLWQENGKFPMIDQMRILM